MTDKTDKLQKLYFRIGEVASIVGVEPHVLRYWESEFRSVRPQKSARGQRIYSRRDVDTLLKVKDLLYAHRFTIAGAKRKLRDGSAVELAVAEAPTQASPSTPPAPAPVADTTDLKAVRERLSTLRERAHALLADADRWGDEDSGEAKG